MWGTRLLSCQVTKMSLPSLTIKADQKIQCEHLSLCNILIQEDKLPLTPSKNWVLKRPNSTKLHKATFASWFMTLIRTRVYSHRLQISSPEYVFQFHIHKLFFQCKRKDNYKTESDVWIESYVIDPFLYIFPLFGCCLNISQLEKIALSLFLVLN